MDHRFASAQSFPTTWQPMLRNGTPLADPPGGAPDFQRDMVGDTANPAVFIASDATHLFLRLRLDGALADPVDPNFHTTTGWGCAIDTDGDLTKYEILAIVDGHGTDSLRYMSNTVKGTDTGDGAESELVNFPASSGLFRTVDATSEFGGNADKFIDIAIPWDTIRTSAAPVAAGTAMRFICGTHNGDFNSLLLSDKLNADIADAVNARGATTIDGKWSEPYVCNSGGTADCTLTDTDGDGIPDAVETALGTNPNSADSDGDGISDLIELTPPGGTTYSFTGVNTDGDGLIDALDTDSDNDGVLDKDEATLGAPLNPDAGASDGGVAGTVPCFVGTLLDTDCDGTPNYRDTDDDNDLILTKDEIANALAHQLSDDLDNDGVANWIDIDSDGDNLPDYAEGAGDVNGNGIPNYLDFDAPAADAAPPPVDAGPPPVVVPTTTAPPQLPPPEREAGVDAGPVVLAAGPAGVLEGTGLFCSSSPRTPSPVTLLGFASVAAAIVARRRRRQ